jgi:hypothetical protein
MQTSTRWRTISIGWNLMLTVAVAVLAIRPASEPSHARLARLDVVERDGTQRMSISNHDELPDLVIEGKHLPRDKRAVQPAGIVLFDEHGNEAGGLATVRRPDGRDGSMLVLDYGHSEAIAVAQSHAGDQYEAALVINDPPLTAASFESVQRIAVKSAARAASIEIGDTHGRPRIRIAVDAADRPSIEILDDHGTVVSRWPGA